MQNAHADDVVWIEALCALGQQAADGAHPRQALQQIVEHVVCGFDADSGSLALIIEGTVDELELAAGTDLLPGRIGTTLPRGMGVYGHVIATRQPLLVNGDAAETGLPLPLHAVGRRSAHSAMCWPLVAAGRTIGALAVNRAGSHPRYTRGDLERGETLVRLVALVVANHGAIVERESRILELSTLSATMQRMVALLEDARATAVVPEPSGATEEIHVGATRAVSASHATNAPSGSAVGSLLSSFDALADELDGTPGSDGVPALVVQAREAMLRVTRIVEDMRADARPVTGTDWEAVDLHRMLDTTLDLVRHELRRSAKVVRCYGEQPVVECMPSRLAQVFLTLLVNASQAIEGNGTITLETGADESTAWVSIDDTGCGIASANLGRLFEPFFTTRPVGQGAGLGLAIANSIVRKHGGRIDVESELGRGTRVTVRLPLRQAPPEPICAGSTPEGADLRAA
jgi:signal transduction histidine kinase